MDRESILNLFHKYGYYSQDKEPFIYDNNGSLGICFSYRDSYYGFLTRVFDVHNLGEAEDFLRKYTWYNKNRKKFPLEIKLSDYKIINPKIMFFCEEQELSYESMIKLDSTNVLPSKDKMYLEKLKRTASILISILKLKIKTQEDTSNNLLKIKEQYYDALEELESKLALYHKRYDKKAISKDKEEEPIFDVHIDELLKTLQSMNDVKEIESFINELIAKLKNTETDEKFIANKYDLISLPLKIDEVNQKIKYLDSLLSKKRGVFSKKEGYEEEFKKIHDNSELNRIVSFEHFLKNELVRIEEKYAMIPELDLRTTGDFFVDFDNLNIKLPKMIGEKRNVHYEDIMMDLEKNYELRSREEKNILILYHSLFYKLKYYLDYQDYPSISYLVNDLYNVLKNENNLLIKIQYLNFLDTYSIDAFLNSLRKSFAMIKSFEKHRLLGAINVFFKGGKDLSKLDYILTSNKRGLVYAQYDGDNDINYIASLDEGLPLLFVPNEINLDYKQDDSLVLYGMRPMLILDTKDFVITKEKDGIIKVARFDIIFTECGNYKIVSELRNNSVELYEHIRMERKRV